MNIFALDDCPKLAAEYHNDRHCIKMILESAQLLCTAHRVLDGKRMVVLSKAGRKQTVYQLPIPAIDQLMYKVTHENHPSAIWARECSSNYLWLYNLFLNLQTVYTKRYGKVHACSAMNEILANLPKNIKLGLRTPFAQAMPEECRSTDPVEAYRNYYRMHKRGMAVWARGTASPPSWWH